MVFRYSMNGANMGSLDVYVVTDTESLVWHKDGDQGSDWKQASIDVGEKKNFKIKFTGIVGKNHQSDIAIDDIQFINCTVGRF